MIILIALLQDPDPSDLGMFGRIGSAICSMDPNQTLKGLDMRGPRNNLKLRNKVTLNV